MHGSDKSLQLSELPHLPLENSSTDIWGYVLSKRTEVTLVPWCAINRQELFALYRYTIITAIDVVHITSFA